MDGWVKLYREILEKPIWLNSTHEQCKILITLLLMANHKPKSWEWQGHKFNLQEGQFITSLDSICKKCGDGISIKNVRTALKRFEKLEFLANESAKTGRLITILNWHLYQSESEEGGKDTGKQVANRWQTGGKQVATNKNVKNDKNVKNGKKNIYGEYRHIYLTEKEYDKLQEDFGNVEALIKHLDEYIEMRGIKYKNHNLAIRKWVVSAVREKTQKNTTKSSNIFDEIGKEEGYW